MFCHEPGAFYPGPVQNERWAKMNAASILVGFSLLFLTGCHNKDELALQPYANIPKGSVIVLQTRGDAKDYTSFPARKFDLILTNECLFEEIRDGAIWVSNSQLGHIGFAGRMVKSIEIKAGETHSQEGSTKL